MRTRAMQEDDSRGSYLEQVQKLHREIVEHRRGLIDALVKDDVSPNNPLYQAYADAAGHLLRAGEILEGI